MLPCAAIPRSRRGSSVCVDLCRLFSMHCDSKQACFLLRSYGRVYATADPYHHTIGPAATYSVGTMVSV